MSPSEFERAGLSEHKGRVIGKDSDKQPSLLTSAALIGMGTLIEPELLTGMVIGAGIVFASKWLPDLVGAVLRPVVKTAVSARYAVAEAVSGTVGQTQDIVAEVRAEREKEAAPA
jgi:hypothetical protein